MTKAGAITRSVVIEREMPHPLERVWRALTQDALIEKWLMQNHFQPVVGHRFNFALRPCRIGTASSTAKSWSSNPISGSPIAGTRRVKRRKGD